MKKYKNNLTPTLILVGLFFGAYSGAMIADSGKDTGATMSAEAIALGEKLIFEQSGFRLDQPTQEGGTAKDRLTQDETQRVCSGLAGTPIDSKTSTKVMSLARESMSKPAGGVKLGKWKKGEAIARSGYGFRIGHKNDDHSKRKAGGNCYACHQLDPNEIAYGTLGPSLKSYGKLRGTSEATLNFAYEAIYNPHVYYPCTQMPRFGHNGVLTEQQISDVMAYLFDPASPVNQ